MKKFYITLVTLFVAMAASAQVYVGGNFGITSVDNGGDDDETYYSFMPEIGYSFNQNWAAGVTFGWDKGNLFSTKNGYSQFSIEPYARYTFFSGKMIDVFCDGAVGYAHGYTNGVDIDAYSIGLKPGVALKLDKFSLVAHVGFLGYQQAKENNTDEKATEWGMNLKGNNLTLGLYYNF